ncbi:MAG: hypothetical protein HY286_06515 [Planctomycetes bacterium]|nr:hypothetical protein [Planctomycetota bacterium]
MAIAVELWLAPFGIIMKHIQFVFLVPYLLIFLSAELEGQSPNLSTSQFLPGSPVVGPAVGNQRSPAMSKGSSSTLLVFEDARSGDSDLFGVRLDASGSPLDSVPFPIAADPANQSAPRVAWNGQSWLVVYTSQVDPGSGYWTEKYYARRVSTGGQVLDSVPMLINDVYSGPKYFGLGSDGQNWVALYMSQDASSNLSLRAKRIAPNGTVLDPNGVLVFAGYGSDLTANYCGGQFLFTWRDYGPGLHGRRFTPQLQPIDAGAVLLPAGPADVTLTSDLTTNGNEYFLAWMRENIYYTSDVVGVRIDASLNIIGNPMITISGSSPSAYHIDPRVVWDGSQWVVAWLTNGSQSALAARVSSTGIVLDPGGVALPDGSPNYLYEPAIGALPGGGALYAWHDIRYAGTSLYDVFGIPFNGTGVSGVERCYSVGSEALRSPRVAPGLNQYLVTFRADLSNASRVMAQRVDSFGNPLDEEPIEVAASTHPYMYSGGAAWNGSVYLVVWTDGLLGATYARRMLPDGSWMDLNPIFVFLGGEADVAALGADFLVTGLHAPSNPQFIGSYGARVRGSDGVVLDNPPLSIGQSYATRSRVVVLGGKWLVVTERHFTHNSNQSNVIFHFVTASGVVSSEFIAANSINIQDWGSIDVASSDSSALIVCQSGSNWTNTDVYARRVLPDGSMPAPLFNITGSVGLGQSKATVAWTGSEYVVGYETLQNNIWGYDLEPDIHGVRISEVGSLVDNSGFALWNDENYEVTVESGSLGNGRALLAASVYVDGAYGSFRISVRGMRPVGLNNYGSGTPGCAGLERMDASGAPNTNNFGFQLMCDRAPANQLGLGIVTDLQDATGSDSFGIGLLMHVGLAGANEIIALDFYSDNLGFGVAAAPIPNDPSLIGKKYFAQAIWLWTPASCVPSNYGLSSSDGLEIQIQSP